MCGIHIGVRPVERWLSIEATYRLAKGLGGNRPRFDADPTDTLLLFDHHYFFSQLRGLNRRSLSCRTTTNTNEIVFVTSWHLLSSLYVELLHSGRLESRLVYPT